MLALHDHHSSQDDDVNSSRYPYEYIKNVLCKPNKTVYHSAFKNKILSHMAMQMNPGNLTLSEISQA